MENIEDEVKRLALRSAHRAAHKAFDRLWRTRKERTIAYQWLREEMGLSEEEGHIGNLDIEQCKQLIRLVEKRKRESD